jgi:hypothetical protein
VKELSRSRSRLSIRRIPAVCVRMGFRCGETSNQQSPSHIYADEGYYNVTLK